MPSSAKVLLSAAGSLIASALNAVWARAARMAPDDAPPPGSRPDPIDDFDPTPLDQLTSEQLAAGATGKITYGTSLGWDGKRFRRYPYAGAEAPPVRGPGAASP
jgi:hypothetical protein